MGFVRSTREIITSKEVKFKSVVNTRDVQDDQIPLFNFGGDAGERPVEHVVFSLQQENYDPWTIEKIEITGYVGTSLGREPVTATIVNGEYNVVPW